LRLTNCKLAPPLILSLIQLFASMSPASAHNGPPFPIVMDRRIGPCIISVWAHPDVGIGTLYVMVDPPPGGTVPKDLKVELGIQPAGFQKRSILPASSPCTAKCNTKPK